MKGVLHISSLKKNNNIKCTENGFDNKLIKCDI